MGKGKTTTLVIMLVLVISTFTSAFISGPLLVMVGKAADVTTSYDNTTTLNVSVIGPEPRINWYDFQYNDTSWVSRRNAQMDVDNSNTYRFILNISSDQGWDDIEYINITAWHDNGSEATTYNLTGVTNNSGGNRNLFIQYTNTSGTGTWTLRWPHNSEVALGAFTITNVTDAHNDIPGYTEAKNLSIAFTPNYQFRYAPGDGVWSNSTIEVGKLGNRSYADDIWSWNFNITVADKGQNNSGDKTDVFVSDEFGVYSYTEIASVGWPDLVGTVGFNATGDNISISTRSNGNYSLSVNVTNLTHAINSSRTIANTTIWLRGGDKSNADQFTGTDPIYLYGSSGTYSASEKDGGGKLGSDSGTESYDASGLEWICSIPIGSQPGEYTATLYYLLTTET